MDSRATYYPFLLFLPRQKKLPDRLLLKNFPVFIFPLLPFHLAALMESENRRSLHI